MIRIAPWRIHILRAVTISAALLAGGSLALIAAGTALAHGDEDSDQASVLVLQAIASIVNAPGDMDAINDKVDDALAAPDQEGVNITQVQAAKEALDAGDMDRARELLQQCLQAGAPMVAAGEDTGTTVVHDALITRGRWTIGTWVTVALSVLVLTLGSWLAMRLRPTDNVRALRRKFKIQRRGPPSQIEEKS